MGVSRNKKEEWSHYFIKAVTKAWDFAVPKVLAPQREASVHFPVCASYTPTRHLGYTNCAQSTLRGRILTGPSEGKETHGRSNSYTKRRPDGLWLCFGQLQASGLFFWSTCCLSPASLEGLWPQGLGILRHCSHLRGIPSPGKDKQAVSRHAAASVSGACRQC